MTDVVTGPLSDDCLAALQRLVEDTAAQHHVASIAWGVVAGGGLAAHGGTGVLINDGRHAHLVADEHAVYRIASMTKSFTAATVLALRDEGVWQLDDPVARHAPELATVTGPSGSAPITIRHLLSMSAGLTTDDAWADRHLDMTPDEIDRVYAAGPEFARLPDSGYEYSNLGYGMLGRAVLRATGVKVQQHITERFLQPLGMDASTWLVPDHDRWARPHRWRDEELVRDWPNPIGDGEIAPMGGIWTTVSDLARWVAWLDSANSTVHQPEAIGLSAASRREMQKIHTFVGVTALAGRSCPSGYGMGLNIREDAQLGKVVAHAGGLPGYGSNMRWLAGRGVGAIALGNSTYAPMGELTMRMLDVVHEHHPVARSLPIAAALLEQAARRLVALLNEWNDADATALFADNVDLDDNLQRRAAQAARLVAEHGTFEITAIRPHVATRGVVDLQAGAARFTMDIELAPVPGAPVQFYEVERSKD